jgi:hypothetical protein
MIDEDPRFPNRKKKMAEEPRHDNETNALDEPYHSGEKSAEEPLHFSGYKIIDPDSKRAEDRPAVAEAVIPSVEVAQVEAAMPTKEPPIPKPQFLDVWIARARKFAENPIRVYAAIGIGLGVIFGVILFSFLWQSDNFEGQYDLGAYISSGAGLSGHLYTQWDKKLQYRLTVEPIYADQREGFALAAANPPRPLSIAIQLQDSHGFVLCARTIVLKYEPGRTEAGKTSLDPLAQANDKLLDEQETKWESGKDVFQNQIGGDGQITSIGAQGTLSCSKESYAKAASWSFLPNFPSLAEQDEWLKRQAELQADTERPSTQNHDVHKRITPKPAAKLLLFSIEGDDAIVEFDVTRGVIETRARKTFFFDKASGAAADSRWQDYPVSIHYKCDQSSNCILSHTGLGALRTRIRQ